MKSYFTKIAFAFVAVLALTLLAGNGQAQPRAARGRVYTKADVGRIISRVEDRSDKFRKEFDKALDHSRLNNSRREDQLNQYAKDLEKATDELRREFDRRDSWIENKDEVKRCLSLASQIDVAMRNRRLGPKVESTWSALRYELTLWRRFTTCRSSVAEATDIQARMLARPLSGDTGRAIRFDPVLRPFAPFLTPLEVSQFQHRGHPVAGSAQREQKLRI